MLSSLIPQMTSALWRRKKSLPAFSQSQGLARSFKTSTPRMSSGIVQHRPSDSPDVLFEFTKENQDRIKALLQRYPPNYKRSAVIPLLYLAQEQNDNWVPLSGMNKIAEILDMAPIRVYEVATFYTMFNRAPVGKFHLQVCGTTPCQLCGAEKIIETIEKHLHVHCGETTANKMFTLSEVECLGACVNAPMLQINNHEFYENLTPETTVTLLDNLIAGLPVKVGPQNGQQTCEGPLGRKTLLDAANIKPVCRDLDAIKEAERVKAEKAKVEAAAKAAAAAAGGAPPKA